ncbi:MAG TPA: hypothetical protein VNN77_03925 [candidate division Zixibacteria bacterium]|nr:hypothetical protein [candidate division Zixibacteria bacterium]
MSGTVRGYRPPRLLSLVLFLTIFFLPLHFHAPTLTVQVVKECSCLFGTRTQAGVVPAAGDLVPVFESRALLPENRFRTVRPAIAASHIRAPPAGV